MSAENWRLQVFRRPWGDHGPPRGLAWSRWASIHLQELDLLTSLFVIRKMLARCRAALLCGSAVSQFRASIRPSIRERGTLGSLSMAILVQHFGELLLERASRWVDCENSKREV